jgi:Domain of unknown function (DUF4157)
MMSFSRISKSSEPNSPSVSKPLFLQPRLSINQPNDIYEQEADAMADKVMRMQANEYVFLKSASNIIQRKCSECEEEDKHVQKKGKTSTIGGMSAPSVVHEAINTGGQSLDAGTRSFMEARFGYDLGNVRVHDDSLAHQSSHEINALAYTLGNHVAFASGQYKPDTDTGKKLLAHELTHVMQQEGSDSNFIQRDGADDVEEESARQGERFRAERRRNLTKAIDLMKFNKVRVDCPKSTNVKLLDVLAGMRSKVAQNKKCIKFFKDNFKINPDVLFDPLRKPSITFNATMKQSGLTRCPEPTPDSPIPSVSIGDSMCTSPHLERIIMHELTHYAQCYVKWGQVSSEEIAEQGAVICIGTVQEALDRAKEKEGKQK